MKVLIVRFSSFGDIVQALSVVDDLVREGADIHWATRVDFAPLLTLNPRINKIWKFDRTKGLVHLLSFAWGLRREKFNLVYDAHSNLRSFVLRMVLRLSFSPPKIIRRSKQRWRRILLFKFGINTFPKPFCGMLSYRWPIKNLLSKWKSPLPQKWCFSMPLREAAWGNRIVLCPGATWEMKRWPLAYWSKLVAKLPGHLFVILGGSKEFDMGKKWSEEFPNQVINLAGKLSLVQSCQVISQARLVVSADTGLIHVADILGVKGLALIGPTAFGHPTGNHIKTLEEDLSCRPCTKDGRGKCSQEVWQKCMVDITPDKVAAEVEHILS